MSAGTCTLCPEPAGGLYSYTTVNGIRRVEEPLCYFCAMVTASIASVQSFEPTTEVAEEGP